MSKKHTKETLHILETGRYAGPKGPVVIEPALAAAAAGTQVFDPQTLASLELPPPRFGKLQVEVTDEKTGGAAQRVAGPGAVMALNFASAKNVGGGFLGGARAQEEDLCRQSGLYRCLLQARPYYDENRACGTMHYTDFMIWSPDVPFFRDDHGDLLDQPPLISVLTAPAPNAGEAARHGESAVRKTLFRRAAYVLRLAAYQQQDVLVLGAWGCGVFRNDPVEVAEAFAVALEALPGQFEKVVFAVYDPTEERENYEAFRGRFGG